jgi:hypothetical protein
MKPDVTEAYNHATAANPVTHAAATPTTMRDIPRLCGRHLRPRVTSAFA